MPILNTGFEDTQRMLALLMQQTAMTKGRETAEAERLASTAKPGQTAAQVGINEKLWRRLYGKDTPYNPSLVLLEETADHKLNNAAIKYINSLTPDKLLDLGATSTNYRMGLPGATTAAGSVAARDMGGRQAEIGNEVSKATKDVQVKGGIAKATTESTTAQTQQATSADIYQRVLQGIQSMERAPAETQAILNEKLAYGMSADEVTKGQLSTQVGISALKQAIIAQRNPNHPMNNFLRANGLNMETALAASAMGLTNMLDDYVRSLHTARAQGREASNIMLRLQTDYAKEIATKVLGGKVTPRQVMAVMDATESGKPVPKGLEGVKALWDNTVDIYYRANVNEALQKGDPYLQALTAQIANAGKLKDPEELDAFNDLARTGSAYAATLLEVGRPTTPEQMTLFNQVMSQHKNRISGVKSANPWYWFPSHTPMNTDPNSGLPTEIQQILANPAAGESTNMKGSIVPKANPNPGMQPALPFTPAAPGTGGLSAEDTNAIVQYLQTLGIGQGAQ